MSKSRANLKIARHPQDHTRYQVVRGREVLCENLETLDDALLWQQMHSWYDEIVSKIKNPNE